MAAPLPALSWDALGQYKREGAFLPGYPDEVRSFFAPVDDVHGVLKALVTSAQHSLVASMFGYDDEELDTIIRGKAADANVYVQLSLDRSQAAGAHERVILAHWHHDAFGTSVAVGDSADHAISHLKALIVDGVYLVGGSTNWSASGESKQDNELRVYRNPVLAAETRARLDKVHTEMLRQMLRRTA